MSAELPCRLPDLAADSTVRDLVKRALDEDVGTGDVTTSALVPDDCAVDACVVARDSYVVSGTAVAGLVFESVDRDLTSAACIADGSRAGPGDVIMKIAGQARAILTAERTALNFLQRMTGIATLTARFVDKVAPHGVTVLDTRKTTPGMRILEKYAVRCGGGRNHRMGLYDRVLIKDNHRRLWSAGRRRSLEQAVAAARKRRRAERRGSEGI